MWKWMCCAVNSLHYHCYILIVRNWTSIFVLTFSITFFIYHLWIYSHTMQKRMGSKHPSNNAVILRLHKERTSKLSPLPSLRLLIMTITYISLHVIEKGVGVLVQPKSSPFYLNVTNHNAPGGFTTCTTNNALFPQILCPSKGKLSPSKEPFQQGRDWQKPPTESHRSGMLRSAHIGFLFCFVFVFFCQNDTQVVLITCVQHISLVRFHTLLLLDLLVLWSLSPSHAINTYN